MPLTLTRTADPSPEPLSTAEAKEHLRVDISADDNYIDALIQAARVHIEQKMRRALITQTWTLQLDQFPGGRGQAPVILVPRPPLQSVESIKYVDLNGVEQTWSSSEYRVDASSEPGRISVAYQESFPNARHVINAITVKFKAGYGDSAADVPQPLLQAMKLLIGHWYEHREAVLTGTIATELPAAVDSLIWPYRVYL